MQGCLLILTTACFCWGFGLADLSLTGPKCGVKECNTDEYCSVYDNQCQPCSGICDSQNHNFDRSLCVKQCQDYIHDVRYVRKHGASSPGADNEESLRVEIDKLEKSMTIVVSILVILVIIIVIWLLFNVYRWKQKKKITFASIKNKLFPRSKTGVGNTVTTEKTNSGVMVTMASGKASDLRLDMPTNHSDGPPTTMTTITRHPAEDSALDYAYDNPAMSTGGTPSPGTRQHQATY